MAKFTCRWIGDTETPLLNDENAADGTPLGSLVTLEEEESFVTFDFLAKYPVWKKGVKGYLTFGIENLSDANYAEEYDYPAPGRSFSVGVELKY